MNALVVDTLSTFGVGVLCLVLAVIGLTLFFKFLSLFEPSDPKPDKLAIRGVIKQDSWLTVHTSEPRTLEHVRFVGFTSPDRFKYAIPYDLHGMVIIEDAEKRRFLLRTSLISIIIVEPAETAS